MVRARCLVSGVVLVACVSARLAYAQTTLKHLAQTHRPSHPSKVELVGGYLYMTDGAGVVTYDVSTPTAPVRTSIVDTPGFAGNVYVYDGHLYVIDGYAGMRVYSLANPAQPQLTAELTELGDCYDIRFVGNRAYLASWDHRCVILDVSDRAAPVVISPGPEGSAYGIEVVGQYAYCVNGYSGMLYTYDISGDIAVQVDSRSAQGGMHEVDSEGGYLYICGGTAVRVFDLSGPAAPTYVTATTGSDGAYDVLVSGTIAWVAADLHDLAVFDVSDPTAPVFLRSVEAPTGTGAEGLARDGDLLAMTDGWNAVHLFDVSTPELPDPVKSIDTSDWFWADSVDLQGDYAYLGLASDTLRILDISDPSQPTEVASVAAWDNIQAADVHGDTLYISALSGFKVIDVTDPTSPVTIAEVPTAESCYGACQGPEAGGHSYAYVANGTDGLVVYDVTSGSTVQTIPTGNYCRDVLCIGSFLYVACWDLKVFDISSPSNPVLVNTTTLDLTAIELCRGEPQQLFVSGTAAVCLLDISSPSSPVVLDRHVHRDLYPSTEGYWGIAYDDGILYVARYLYGVLALRVVDDRLTYETDYDTPYRAYGVAAQNGLVAVADDWSGMHLLRARTGPNAAPEALVDANPVEGLSPLTVDFTCMSSDTDGSIVDFSWSFGDGQTGTGATVSHTYTDRGSFTATLTVTDDEGATGTAYVVVTVLNHPPVAVAAADTTTPEAGEQLALDGSNSTDADEDALSFSWDFGDGMSAVGVSACHYYRVEGSYTVTLTVEDGAGGSDSDTLEVTVATPTDMDTDGIPDVWELLYFSDLGECDSLGDADLDGLTDAAEFQCGTDPTNEDTDGDGHTDGGEANSGTDPLDPASFPGAGVGSRGVGCASCADDVDGSAVVVAMLLLAAGLLPRLRKWKAAPEERT